MLNKTYLCVGIGDFFCLDSLLTEEERFNIETIYWGCRFGSVIHKVLFGNPAYPNFKESKTIDDNIGKNLMQIFEPNATEFWHFRPDFKGKAEAFLSLFNETVNSVNILDAVKIFKDPNRKFTKSTMFHKNELPSDLHVSPGSYILVHYPTSSRPMSDRSTITESDWENINKFSNKLDMKVIVVSDQELNLPLSNYKICHYYDPGYYPALIKNCGYFLGCDSFMSVLASRSLPAERISIKAARTHITDIDYYVNNAWTSKYFLPYSPDVVKTFLKHEFEYKI